MNAPNATIAPAAEGNAPAFCFPTGQGQEYTHALQRQNGEPNRASHAGQPYPTITGREIAAMVEAPPLRVDKARGQWFIPSTYAAHDARSHDAQRARGSFNWLGLDVDENDLPLGDVLDALRGALGACRFLAYSTPSATAQRRKWRVLVPLAAPLAGADFTDTQDAFFSLLIEHSQGALIPDPALKRPAQLIYLPNPQGDFYEREICRDAPVLALTAGHAVTLRREENRAKRAEAEKEAKARRERRAAGRAALAFGESDRPGDIFNTRHSVADLLARYGYVQCRGSNDWRSPMQTSKSFATRDMGEYWISLSASDAAAGIGSQTKSGCRFGDAFDLFVHFDHGGDMSKAAKAYWAELHPFGELSPLSADPADDLRADFPPPALPASPDLPPAAAKDADPVDLWGQFDPPDLPPDLLPQVVEDFARVQGDRMGADPAGLAVAALVTCAAAIPDNVKIQVKEHDLHWTESARLWAALVGPPSTKKSPIITAATGPLCRLDMQMFRDWQNDVAEFNAIPKDERAGRTPPPQRRLRIEDTTIEAAQVVLEGSPWGVLLLQDELSGWFGAMDKYNGGKGANADRAFWLRAFNGGEFALNRVGRGAAIIPNLSVCLLGGIQPDPIRRVAADAQDDGLLQRLFPVILRPATMGRDEPAPDVAATYCRLIDALRQTRPPGWMGNQVVRFDAKAQAVRRDLEAEHLRLQSLESINGKLAAHIGKYDGMFARLCLTWHCIENAGALHLPEVIGEGTARRVAAVLHRFLLRHALAFYSGVLGLSDDHDRLAALASYIIAHRRETVTGRDVQQSVHAMRGLEERDIRRLFEQLEAMGWLNQTPGPRPSSPPVWRVNPAAHAKFAERATRERQRRAEVRETLESLRKGGIR